MFILEQWRDTVVDGMQSLLHAIPASSEQLQLHAVHKRIEELTMDHELLFKRCKRYGVSPTVPRRSST